MTQLSDTACILLSAASQRTDGNLLPLPEALIDRKVSVHMAIRSLLRRGYVEDYTVDDARPADFRR